MIGSLTYEEFQNIPSEELFKYYLKYKKEVAEADVALNDGYAYRSLTFCDWVNQMMAKGRNTLNKS